MAPTRGGQVAIAGAGMTGAYLYRLLRNAGCDVQIFDRLTDTRCGLTPCAWGTSADFWRLVSLAGLDPQKYLLRTMDHLELDGLTVKMQLMTFHKPALIRDLLAGASINYAPIPAERFDRIIDATGAARALLPPIPGDILLDCCQYLLESKRPLETRVHIVGCGYAWCFPLSGGRYHVGCGSLVEEPRGLLRRIGWYQDDAPAGARTVCGCQGTIRVTGAHHSLPFVTEGDPPVWGVGEAIGCVAPLVGDGVVPGMRSVELLMEQWESPHGYRDALLSEFGWMKEEREVVDALKQGASVGLREARVLMKNSRRMHIELGIREVLGILRILAEKYLLGATPG